MTEEVSQALARRRELEEELHKLERQIYNLESSYLDETWNLGNVVKGFDGYLSSRAKIQQRKSKFRDQDRIFSSSSISFSK